ncbi:MAG TPA: hypothetical protein DDW27_05095 [Bacteroidales bacterium]|nr:hypothetical protein [Bacteroidales bacterium]
MIKFLALNIFLILHPVHVSLTSIDHIPDTDTVKVFVRMYYDDFLLDYKILDKSIDPEYYYKNQYFPIDLMSKYLAEKVIISVNNKRLEGRLINMELAAEENEISINLVYHSDRKPEIISIRNEIMTGLYDDQANMTIVRISGVEEGIKLTPEKTEQTLILN